MVFDFLQPVSDDILSFVDNLSEQTLGKKTSFHTTLNFPNFESFKIAIITVNEYRGGNSHNEDKYFLNFRKKFYSLYPGNWDISIADLGTINEGNTIEDTYFLITSICEDLMRKKIIPIIIGGTQDLTYPMYRSYDNLDQMVNLVAVDNQFDFGKENSIPEKKYLSKIIVEEPNNLFNFSNLGFQTYYNSQEEIDLLEKLFFEALRLGEVSKNLKLAEPIFRDADLVSFDLNCIQTSFSGNFTAFEPNGFDGKEICTLARYAGISDKISAIGVFNFENSQKGVVLLSQIIWYFIEGVAFRSNEYPFETKGHFIKYIVPIDKVELVFYKSDNTDRWWIEIPFILNSNNKLKKNTLLPCTYDDYLAACEQEIPERWWKAQRRNLL